MLYMGKKQTKGISARESDAATSSTAQSKDNTSAPTTPTAVTSDCCNQSKTEASSVPAPANKMHTMLYRYVYRLSKAAQGYMIKKLPLIIPSALLMLLGFKQLPSNIPLLNLAREHRVASPIIGAVLVLLFVAAMIFPLFPTPKPKDENSGSQGSTGWPIRPWVIATAMSTTSFFISSILLLIVLIRPVWCPSTLCLTLAPAPLIYGPHDANLEVNFTGIQSPAYVLTKSSAQYSLSSNDLPTSNDRTSIGAVLIGARKTSSHYIVALTIHNLRSKGYTMIIEEVALVVKQTPSTPVPLNVLAQPPSILYQNQSGNLYNVDYQGQRVNAVLPATYVHLPGGYVQLRPIETDSLYLQVTPRLVTAVDLRFSVQITYRIANEARSYSFTPPYVFEVVFAKTWNWHPYHLQDGRLVKS
jgi:hypothetical protein